MVQSKPLRGYYIYERGSEWGIPVVATSARKAQYIAFKNASELDCNWIDLRCKWRKETDVAGLPVGIVVDAVDALRRGFYQHLEGACDVCGEDGYLESVGGKAMCEECRGGV